ncbi:MAG: carbohydrate ABC transporter permease [bacterium]
MHPSELASNHGCLLRAGPLDHISARAASTPRETAFIPALRIFRSVGLAGTYVGVWLAHAAFALPLMVYLMHNFISEIPKDVIESAIIDGAGSFQVYARLIMPLAISAVASLLIFQFIWVWNDLLIALIFVGRAAVELLESVRRSADRVPQVVELQLAIEERTTT